MPPKVGQRARGEHLPNKPKQPPRPVTPSASTAPTPDMSLPAKAGPPKEAMDIPAKSSSQAHANPPRATIHDTVDRDDD